MDHLSAARRTIRRQVCPDPITAHYDDAMPGLFDGTPLERPVTCAVCGRPTDDCRCPRDAAGEVRLPGDQRVRLRLEKRRKGKVVTAVAGLDPAASDLPDLLRRLRRECGCGGAVSDDGTIELQGDHRVRVGEALSALGYPVDR